MALTIQLKLRDETDQAYADRNPKSRYKAMEDTLERFKDLDPKGRFVIFAPEQVRELEDHLGEGIGDGPDLLRRIKVLTTMNVGDLKIPLSQDHLGVLKERAAYWDKDFDSYVRQEVERALKFMVTGRY